MVPAPVQGLDAWPLWVAAQTRALWQWLRDDGGHTSTFVSPGVSTGNSVVVVIVAVVVCAVVAAAYGMQWSEQTTTITTMVKCTVLLYWCYCTGTAGRSLLTNAKEEC